MSACNATSLMTEVAQCAQLPYAPYATAFDFNVAYEMVQFANAAYDTPPTKALLPPHFNVTATFTDELSSWVGAPVMLGCDLVERRIVVAFRGTDTLPELIKELTTPQLVQVPGSEGAMANKFFYDAWASLEPRIFQALWDLSGECDGCDIWVTGHSLGGAMASLAAYHLSQHPNGHKVLLYTFGEPRVGNPIYADDVDKALERRYFRVTVGSDPIPNLPPCASPQACNRTDWWYYHSGLEIWFPTGERLNGTMCGYRECLREPKGEDWSCILGAAFHMVSNILDHHMYFDVLGHGYCHGAPQPKGPPLSRSGSILV